MREASNPSFGRKFSLACVGRASAALAFKAIALGFVILGAYTQLISLDNKGGYGTPLKDLERLSEIHADYEYFSANGMMGYFWNYYSYPLFCALVFGASALALVFESFTTRFRFVLRVSFAAGIVLIYLAGCAGILFFMGFVTGVPFLIGAAIGFFLPFHKGIWLRKSRHISGKCLACGYPLDETQQLCPECGATAAGRR